MKSRVAVMAALCCAVAFAGCRGASPSVTPPMAFAQNPGVHQTSFARPFITDTWSTLSSMVHVRDDFPTVALNGKLYAIGGLGPTQDTAVVNVYDPTLDSWSTAASLPTPREGVAAAAVNGIIYAIGGSTNCGCVLHAVVAYDPNTDSWTPRSQIPFGRFGGAAAVVNNIIYVIGGYDDTWGPTASVQAYDPSTDKWTNRAAMIHPTVGSALAVVGTDIYLIGNVNPYTGPAQTFRVYHTDTNTWQSLRSLPVAIYNAAAVTIGTTIYVAGGTKAGGCGCGAPSDALWAYDTVARTWTKMASMPGTNGFPSGAALNGLFYVVGGNRYSSGLRTLYSYTP